MKRALGFISSLLGRSASVIPSKRFAAYVAAGAVLFALAALIPGLLVLPLAYNAFLLVVVGMDLWLSPRPGDFEVWREVEAKMNLGALNQVTLHSRNATRHAVQLQVRDEPPQSWPVQTGAAPSYRDGERLPPVPLVHIDLAGGAQGQGHYQVTPTRRGDFVLGPLTARFGSLLGFWHRQFSTSGALGAEAEQHVRVYPDTSEVRRYELGLRENRVQNAGLHILRLRGRGTEFESLREYTTGDEYKSINWKASARSGKLISTNYEIERDQSVIICLDCGRMMTSLAVNRQVEVAARAAREAHSKGSEAAEALALADPTPLSKLDCAINATVLLAHVAASMGDAVGLLLFSDAVVSFLPPRKGKLQTGQIIETLYNAQPSLVEPDYQAAYEYLMGRKLRRSLVVTFTDIIDPEASQELLNASAALRRHHNALCVTINNRDVMDMAELLPQSGAQMYAKAMAERMLLQRGTALEQLRSRGVGILDVEAAGLTVATVNRYLSLKSRGTL